MHKHTHTNAHKRTHTRPLRSNYYCDIQHFSQKSSGFNFKPKNESCFAISGVQTDQPKTRSLTQPVAQFLRGSQSPISIHSCSSLTFDLTGIHERCRDSGIQTSAQPHPGGRTSNHLHLHLHLHPWSKFCPWLPRLPPALSVSLCSGFRGHFGGNAVESPASSFRSQINMSFLE